MASITKRGEKYLVRWYDPDGTQRGKSVPNHATAKKLQRAVEEQVALGKAWEDPDSRSAPTLLDWSLTRAADAKPEDEPDRTITGGVFRLYLIDAARELAPGSHVVYTRALVRFVEFVAKRTRRKVPTAKDLTRDALSAWWAELRHVEGLAISTCNLYVTAVNEAWAWAHEHEEHGELVPRPRKIGLPARPKVPVVAPTWAHTDAFLHTAQQLEQDARTWVDARHWRWRYELGMVLRCTGLRRLQAMMLRMNDFDLDAAVLVIRGELGKSRAEKMGRVVPVAPVLVAFLRELEKLGRKPDDFVIGPHYEGRKDAATKGMYDIWRASKVPEKVYKGRPDHCFRKAFTSGLKRLGADSEAVEYLIGHSEGGVREDYLDPDALPLRDAVARVPAVAPLVILPFKIEADGSR